MNGLIIGDRGKAVEEQSILSVLDRYNPISAANGGGTEVFFFLSLHCARMRYLIDFLTSTKILQSLSAPDSPYNQTIIDRILFSVPISHIPDPNRSMPFVMEEVQQIIYSCISWFLDPGPRWDPLKDTENLATETVLRSLSGYLKQWRKLVQSFFIVSQNTSAARQLIINVGSPTCRNGSSRCGVSLRIISVNIAKDSLLQRAVLR